MSATGNIWGWCQRCGKTITDKRRDYHALVFPRGGGPARPFNPFNHREPRLGFIVVICTGCHGTNPSVEEFRPASEAWATWVPTPPAEALENGQRPNRATAQKVAVGWVPGHWLRQVESPKL